MTTYVGTVRDHIIVLPEGSDLPDGTLVEIRVVASPIEEPESGDHTDPDMEERFLQALQAQGLLREIKRPPRDAPPRDRTPIRVQGKPLSEQIIEDRR